MSASDDATTDRERSNRDRPRVRKQPFLSAGMSILIAGLGQVYNGQYLRGALFIAATLTIMLVTQTVSSLSLQASAAGLVLHVVAAYDAYNQAHRINAEADR